MEEWRPVKGYEGRYEVSSLGRVRSLDFDRPYSGQKPRRHKGKILSQPVSKQLGYRYVGLCDGKTSRCVLVHRLVAEAFVDRPASRKRLCVNHIDGNKLNNVPENLEWVTWGENNLHAYRAGLRVGPKRKFSKEQVRYIRSVNKSCGQLARDFGADVKTVWKIRTKKTYKEVS